MPHKPQPCDKVFISSNLQEFLADFKRTHKYWKWIYDMRDTLLYDRLAGESIPKRQIPDKYRRKYGVNNLYRYQHPEGYRSCYILVNIPGEGLCAQVLDLLSHPEYEELFGYSR